MNSNPFPVWEITLGCIGLLAGLVAGEPKPEARPASAAEPLTFNIDPASTQGDRLAHAIEADLLSDWDGWQARVNPKAWEGFTPEQRFTNLGHLWELHQRALAIRQRYDVTILRTDEYPHPAYQVGGRYAPWQPIRPRLDPTIWIDFAEWVQATGEDERPAQWREAREAVRMQCLDESGWIDEARKAVEAWDAGDGWGWVSFHDGGRTAAIHRGSRMGGVVTLLVSDLGLRPPAVAMPAEWSMPPAAIPNPLDGPSK